MVGKVPVLHPPVGDGAGDSVDHLSDLVFASTIMRIGALGDISVKILRDGDFGGEFTPGGGDLDVFWSEHDTA